MITPAEARYIAEQPDRIFNSEAGRRICDAGIKTFHTATMASLSALRLPELRDKIDVAVRRDITKQAMELFGTASVIVFTMKVLQDPSLRACKSEMEGIISVLFLDAYKKEDNLRRLCRSTLSYYVPNFESILEEQKDGSF